MGVPLKLFAFFDPSNTGNINLYQVRYELSPCRLLMLTLELLSGKCVDSEQVFIILTVFCKGDIGEKVRFAFRMMDTDGSGEIEPVSNSLVGC